MAARKPAPNQTPTPMNHLGESCEGNCDGNSPTGAFLVSYGGARFRRRDFCRRCAIRVQAMDRTRVRAVEVSADE